MRNVIDPIFTEEQLNRMGREDMLSLLKIMQGHCQKQEKTLLKRRDVSLIGFLALFRYLLNWENW